MSRKMSRLRKPADKSNSQCNMRCACVASRCVALEGKYESKYFGGEFITIEGGSRLP